MGSVGVPVPLLYLDTNVFIHAVEGAVEDEACRAARSVLTVARRGLVNCMTSELTLAETLTPSRNAKMSHPQIARAYLALIVHSSLITLEPLIRQDMYEGAKLGEFQKQNVRLPDRLHLATAIRFQADYFVTDDGDIRCPQEMQKLHLTEKDVSRLLPQKT